MTSSELGSPYAVAFNEFVVVVVVVVVELRLLSAELSSFRSALRPSSLPSPSSTRTGLAAAAVLRKEATSSPGPPTLEHVREERSGGRRENREDREEKEGVEHGINK